MRIQKSVRRVVDIGPLKIVLRMGPEGTAARLDRGMKTICKVCRAHFELGDSLCAGFLPTGENIGILHERCLDEQARSVIKNA